MNLPVLPSTHGHASQPATPTSRVGARVEELAEGLRGQVRGQVRFGTHDRMLWSTDASMYQVTPLGVVVPQDTEDTARAVEWLSVRGVPILPRGGGTSLAGQCTGRAVVIDQSAHCRRVWGLDAAGLTVRAEAGATPDQVNAAVAGAGLFFAPDPATVAQATIGGCVGNNAAGSRSIKYGRTSENVLGIDAVLAGGARVSFGPGAGRRSAAALKLADGVSRIARAHAAQIRARFPRTPRRNAGYALDAVLDQLERGVSAQDLDLVPLLCGSEGTLAVTLGALLRLRPLPRGRGLGLLSYQGVEGAIAAVPALLATGPSAVELIDEVVIEAARGNIECAPYVEAFPRLGGAGDGAGRQPGAVLYVEYQEASQDEVNARLSRLRVLAGGGPVRVVTDAAGMADAWKLRKAGEPLLHGLPGSRKPVSFVEDNAVPVENLARFVREFRRIVEREGTRAAFWAHASVGVLHVRPMLDPKDAGDRARLLRIAVEAADLARRCGGVMSGEHGDGRVRGPLLERHFGAELMGAFAAVKGLFDPAGVLNPGNIVAPGPVGSILERTRVRPGAGLSGPETEPSAGPALGEPDAPAVETYFAFADQGGLLHAAEMCNGAGVCRKQSGGTMCPSYRATLDERHSTRGRGNALRLAVTGQVPGGDRFDDPETVATLGLCLSCKACKSECPSNVDVSRLKAEYTAQRFKGGRVGGLERLRAWLIGRVRALNRAGSAAAPVANAAARWGPTRALINTVMGIDPRRSLPGFSPSLFALVRDRGVDGVGGVGDARPAVALFGDCFTAYNESGLGVAAARLLEGLGYRVILPAGGGWGGCCGRSMISVGMLAEACREVRRTAESLRAVVDDPRVRGVLFLEPSCLSAVRDDWLDLRSGADGGLLQRLAGKSWLVEDFIDRAWDEHPSAGGRERLERGAAGEHTIVLHAHCHQKALWGAESSGRLLRRVAGARVRVLASGCCGMAGSFGYSRDRYELSMRIAELTGEGGQPGGGVLPMVRAARESDPGAEVLATGTSCRHQIKDGTAGVVLAEHPVVWLARAYWRGAAAASGPATAARIP
ncbi:MAG: FAD-binding oxidoreductase [Planctomyces sp.]|nr:FAD-binding oxidoreductase [Planctomyces sp.]